GRSWTALESCVGRHFLAAQPGRGWVGRGRRVVQLPGAGQCLARRLQPDPRLPSRRWPGLSVARLGRDRRHAPSDSDRRLRWPGGWLVADPLGLRPSAQRRFLRWAVDGIYWLVPEQRG